MIWEKIDNICDKFKLGFDMCHEYVSYNSKWFGQVLIVWKNVRNINSIAITLIRCNRLNLENLKQNDPTP